MRSYIIGGSRCRIECSVDGKIAYLEFDQKYEKYVTDSYDGFLVLVLPMAMKKSYQHRD